ncbi:MAG TPA: energy transducer TonB [Blastocatellia bacterium]|jgi:TonB family protein|nr:energy transducer TonB [Blastocatellia bacterium]
MSNLCILIFTALISFSGSVQSPSNQIPPAALPSGDDVKQWWEQLRAAGAEAAKAHENKEATLKEKRNRRGRIPDDEDELLSKKDRDRLNAEIATATGNYLGLLREGKEKGYRVPLRDSRPIVLHRAPARYTNAARDARVQGVVVLSIEFQPDGTLKVVRVESGLGYGVDEKAVAATRKVVFLPAIKDGAFVNMPTRIEFTFNMY